MEYIQPSIQLLASRLLALRLQMVIAESCTGGMLSALITEIPGSSVWFERGFVTYSNLAKQEMLGVDPELIKQHGAVSGAVAKAMASGALNHSAGQLAVAITGIAGPSGGSIEKPVGTVWIGWAKSTDEVQIKLFQFHGDRQAVRIQACYEAIQGCLDFF